MAPDQARSGCGSSGRRPTEECQECSDPDPPAGAGQDHQAVDEDGAGAVLRAWRLVNGRTQVEVARRLRTTQQHLSQIENGHRSVSLDLRRRIVQSLGVPAEELGLAGEISGSTRRRGEGPDVLASQMAWRAQRRSLNSRRGELSHLAAGRYPKEWQIPDCAYITHPDWCLGGPVDLRGLKLNLTEGLQCAALDGREPQTQGVRPLMTSTRRFDTYTSAIRHLDAPRLFESRPSYQLLGGSLSSGSLNFGLAGYFEKLDVSEALAHEFSLSQGAETEFPRSTTGNLGDLPFRDMISDPFDPKVRKMMPGITTLTVRLRRHPAEPSFLVHWRDPAKVATGGGVYSIIPAGEFQPASLDLWDRHRDFDLWRNIVREYSEELLGSPEHDGTRSHPIDYERWSLYRQLQQARERGTVQVWLLGMGLNALTLGATLLTVVVIDDDEFRRIFRDAVQVNDEGELVADPGVPPVEGVPFTRAAVRQMLDSQPIAPSAAACLSLAWQRRHDILGL
jgi:transcriptional regulator with XRE-family HTH domain